MTCKIVVISAALALLLCWSACAQEPQGATIVFGPDSVLVYQGVGANRAAEPTTEPVSVGNFVINRVLPPSESDLGDFGMTIRYRCCPDQSMLNTQTWGWAESRVGLVLACQAKDLEAPLGFRMRAQVLDRSQNQAWLYLDIGPNAWHRHAAVTANRRRGRGAHFWYVRTDMPSIYAGREVKEPFAIVLGIGGWGACGVQKIEILPY